MRILSITALVVAAMWFPYPTVYARPSDTKLETLEHMRKADKELAPHDDEYYCQHLWSYELESSEIGKYCAELLARKK